jgi:hypothetical protein
LKLWLGWGGGTRSAVRALTAPWYLLSAHPLLPR